MLILLKDEITIYYIFILEKENGQFVTSVQKENNEIITRLMHKEYIY